MRGKGGGEKYWFWGVTKLMGGKYFGRETQPCKIMRMFHGLTTIRGGNYKKNPKGNWEIKTHQRWKSPKKKWD